MKEAFLKFPIHKLQVLADQASNHPIFYNHFEDQNHKPYLQLTVEQNRVVLHAEEMLFKVKQNPQTKNRMDIYMSLAHARTLGAALMQATHGKRSWAFRVSSANPARGASRNMALPEIVSQYFGKHIGVGANFQTGTQFLTVEGTEGYINVDLERPHVTHIKMKGEEIHIGIPLSPPSGKHNPAGGHQVDVPLEELQTGRAEQNPLLKVYGGFVIFLSLETGRGLGELLTALTSIRADFAGE